MRKIFLIIGLAVALGGCSFETVKNAIAVATSSAVNPVSTTRLSQAVSAYGVTLSGMVAYRDSCNKKLIGRSCRDIVVKLQEADKKAQVAIIEANTFVKNNPTLNASGVIETAISSINAFKQIAITNGVVK